MIATIRPSLIRTTAFANTASRSGETIVTFAIVFPFLPAFKEQPKLIQLLLTLGMKIPLLLPIAGISYEIIRFSGKVAKNPKWSRILAPGMALQWITTREPEDDQIEVALASLRAALDHEKIDYEGGDFPVLEVEEAAAG